ncbi:fimbria/pilus outer membrane usher protein [Escherichia coli]
MLTNPFGYAVVPYLTTYQENRLSVDTTQLPDNVNLRAKQHSLWCPTEVQW